MDLTQRSFSSWDSSGKSTIAAGRVALEMAWFHSCSRYFTANVEDFQNPTDNYPNPFTRSTTLSSPRFFQTSVLMGAGSQAKELAELFESCPTWIPTSSAFTHRKGMIHPVAFQETFRHYTKLFLQKPILSLSRDSDFDSRLKAGFIGSYPILTADGTDIPYNLNLLEPDYIYENDGEKRCNIVHVTTLYMLSDKGCTFIDAIDQPYRKKNEYAACAEMLELLPSNLKEMHPVLLADRGFSSFNVMAHCFENGLHFCLRCKGTNARRLLESAGQDTLCDGDKPFDTTITVRFRRGRTAENQAIPGVHILSPDQPFDYICDKHPEYTMKVRIMRFKLSSGEWEYLYTDLYDLAFDKFKDIYFRRWGIETSFDKLKNSANAVSLHSRKINYVLQEIYSKLILYNICEHIRCSIEYEEIDGREDIETDFTATVTSFRRFAIRWFTDNWDYYSAFIIENSARETGFQPETGTITDDTPKSGLDEIILFIEELKRKSKQEKDSTENGETGSNAEVAEAHEKENEHGTESYNDGRVYATLDEISLPDSGKDMGSDSVNTYGSNSIPVQTDVNRCNTAVEPAGGSFNTVPDEPVGSPDPTVPANPASESTGASIPTAPFNPVDKPVRSPSPGAPYGTVDKSVGSPSLGALYGTVDKPVGLLSPSAPYWTVDKPVGELDTSASFGMVDATDRRQYHEWYDEFISMWNQFDTDHKAIGKLLRCLYTSYHEVNRNRKASRKSQLKSARKYTHKGA